ncbi:neuropeptides capa receptor-like [Orbicella faveolata]|uniref:neuropeptides capa receptor-like n=1 Tax=Orbicella faveolata TaxID=48498 RepID=UPI0009E607A5|nr:neuropeptides capa receptor-like [Orbicella faveolata]
MDTSTHVSSNGSPSCPSGVSVFFTTAMAVISLAAFIGNILVIAAVYKTPSLKTSANYYYVNMAVSDFLSSLTTWPLYLTNEIITSRGSLIQGPLATVGCKVGVFFRVVSITVSILSLVLIAVDRFVAILFPLKATLITRKMRAALLLTTWFVSIAYCIPMGYYFRAEKVGQETYCKFAWNDSALMIYYITGLVLFQLLPLLAIIILYSRIMSALRQRSNAEYTARCGCNNQQNRCKQTQNFMKIFRSIVVVLFTWFSLFTLYLILKIISPALFINDRCKWILGFTYFLIPSLGIAINPVILFTYSTNFRQALPRLLPFSFRQSRSSCTVTATSRRPKLIQLHFREI